MNKKYRFVVDNKVVMVSLKERRAIMKARQRDYSLTQAEQKTISRVSLRADLSKKGVLKLSKNNLILSSAIENKKLLSRKEQRAIIADMGERIKRVKPELSKLELTFYKNTWAKELVERTLGKPRTDKLFEEMNSYENTSPEEIKMLEELDLDVSEYDELVRGIKAKASKAIGKFKSESQYYKLIKQAKGIIGKFI